MNTLKLLQENANEASKAIDLYRSNLFIENWLESGELDELLPKIAELSNTRELQKLKRLMRPFINDLLYSGQLIESTMDERKSEIMRDYNPLQFDFLRERVYSGLTVIGAAQGTGKSSMLFNILFEFMKKEKRIVYIDCENQTREFDFKFYQLYSMRKHQVPISFEEVVRDKNHRAAAAEIMGQLRERLTLIAHQTPSGPEIAGYCLNMEQKPDAVIVDYIQLLRGTNSKNTIRENMIQNTQALRELANELDIPVFIASQLNKDGELRESQTMLDNATLAIYLERVRDNGQLLPMINVTCKKNRRGPVGEDYNIPFEAITQTFGKYDS